MLNLFSSKKRTRTQSLSELPSMPGGSDQQKTQQFLRQQHQAQLSKFSHFLSNHYLKFDYKINRCSYKCIKNAGSYKQISECQRKCGEGVKKFDKFVSGRVQQMQILLNQCVDQTRSLPNSLDEVYRCFMIYNQSFEQLKIFIQQESMFYQ